MAVRLAVVFLAMEGCLSLAYSQSPPRIGLIDIYGLRKVPEAKIRQALGAREGDPLPASKGNVEEKINAVDGVVESHLEAVCCEAGKMILYVGVEERGVPHFEIRESPEGEAALPEEVIATHRRLAEALQSAIRKGMTGEDLTRGHSLVSNPEARAIQDMLPAMADEHLVALQRVLRESPEESQRAAAAEIIGYATKKSAIVNDLQFALRDSDITVRGNAARALAALAVLQRLNPASGVKVSPTWFIEMLNSLSWSDRNRAVGALQILTDARDAGILDQLRERALPSLVEMARWKSPAHAIPAFMLLGRVAGIPDVQLEDTWSRGDRESVIKAAAAKRP